MNQSSSANRHLDVHVRMAPIAQLHTALSALASEITGLTNLHLTHACASCGSSQHGRPVVRGGADGVTASLPGVSLSRPRVGDQGVVAVCTGAQVGIDLEATGAASFPGFDSVAPHPQEHCHNDDDRTRLWVRKEALLKAHGTGLVTDPRSVHLSPSGAVLEGPAGTVIDVDLRPDWCCSVAITPAVGPERVNVRLH
ncbi:4'-phosphopantetheinyl transferase family protein [Kocuria sp.]|uniref:4'-phosphopantetheinyl transferase family protein n=1 Tax=Kocuria sp. TaxID=1871328 RepID=UPI0026DFC172|nr:4'-phosphopantetheinyl transferase superfamily protein [Kocuria sp.]MDO5619439.1 4'-phosphopantetheinyl transferase superfamily protein [Kocuria sp.]